MTATDEDLAQLMTEGATLGGLLQALDKAGADPVADLHEGLYGPSVAAIGYGGIAILNAFALVATDPAGLGTHPDPVGPGSDACLAAFFQPGDTVVAAWGRDGARFGRAAEVTQTLTAAGVRFLCLGVTANGQPRHPGRLAYSTPLTAWEPA